MEMTLNELLDYLLDVGPYGSHPPLILRRQPHHHPLQRILRSPKMRESQGLRNIGRTVTMRVYQRKTLKRTP